MKGLFWAQTCMRLAFLKSLLKVASSVFLPRTVRPAAGHAIIGRCVHTLLRDVLMHVNFCMY